MRVAVFGFYHALNAGDDRIQYSLTRFLRSEGHDVVFLPHSHKPCIQYLKRFDWILIGGGGLVFERHGIWSNMRRWMRKSKARIGVVGLGVNRLDVRLRKEVLDLLRYSSFFLVRDEKSRTLLSNDGRVNVFPDVTWMYPLEPTYAHTRQAANSRRVALNLAPCHWKAFDPDAWHSALHEREVLPFPLFMTEDRDVGLLRRTTGKEVSSEFSLIPLIESRILIASRFHALVFAIMIGRPFVAIAYDDKVARMCSEFGLEHLCLDTDQHDMLQDRLRYIDENYSEICDRLHRIKCDQERKADLLKDLMCNELNCVS